MDVVVLGICACSLLVSGVALFRANFYRWELCSLIQLDRRYADDSAWRREADSALRAFREAEFALKYGLVSAHPRWHRRWVLMFLGGIAFAFLVFAVFEGVSGRPVRFR